MKNLRTPLSVVEPTECQSASIPLLAENLDVVIAAETGEREDVFLRHSNRLKYLEKERNRTERGSFGADFVPERALVRPGEKAIDILTLPDDLEDDSEKKSIVRTVALTPDRGLPSSFPDIIVCTPARAEQDVFDWREGSWRKGSVYAVREIYTDGCFRRSRYAVGWRIREESAELLRRFVSRGKLAATRGFYKTFEDESEINVKTTTGEWNNDLERDTEESMEQNWRKDHDFEEEEEEEDKKEDDSQDDDDENEQQHEYEYERKEQQKKEEEETKALSWRQRQNGQRHQSRVSQTIRLRRGDGHVHGQTNTRSGSKIRFPRRRVDEKLEFTQTESGVDANVERGFVGDSS